MVYIIRNFRMGVTVGTETIVVRGQFLSRSIPREAVVNVDRDDAVLRWKSTSGSIRRTPVTAFTNFLGFGGLPPVTVHNSTQLRLLDQFLDRSSARHR